jgi:tRNA(His) guanylyltransferase
LIIDIAIIIMQGVMREFPDIILAFGESDEYSFVLHKDTTLYGGYELVCMDVLL